MTTVAQYTPRRKGHRTPTACAPAPVALPEAACSITLRVPMPGYADHALITGRGQTGAEAAQQWQTTRDALVAVLTPPAPTREERLTALLTKGLTCATQRQDWHLVERLSKAAALVLAAAIEPGERAGLLAVRSQREADHWYEVDGLQCSCPDFARHARNGERYQCKHVLAALLWTRLSDDTTGRH